MSKLTKWGTSSWIKEANEMKKKSSKMPVKTIKPSQLDAELIKKYEEEMNKKA